MRPRDNHGMGRVSEVPRQMCRETSSLPHGTSDSVPGSCSLWRFYSLNPWICLNEPVSVCDKSKKGKFLYSAVSSLQDRSKRFTLYFHDRPVHWDTISASLGNIQPYATINARRLLIYVSTTVYSQILIYTAEWTGAMTSEKTCPRF